MVLSSGTLTHTRTCKMPPNANRNEHWLTAFSYISRDFICCSLRKILCAQDSQSDLTAGRHSNICSVLRMTSFVHVFVNRFMLTCMDHDQTAAKLTNRWISGSVVVGGSGTLCQMNTWRERELPGEQWSRHETEEGMWHEMKFRWRGGHWSARTVGTDKTGGDSHRTSTCISATTRNPRIRDTRAR